ncbi:MAG: hypothetical protein Kow00105_00220 [Phycisphaeraceae bacterium]
MSLFTTSVSYRFLFALIPVMTWTCLAHANGEKLMGVHWWDYGGPGQVGPGPDGGWSTETIITHSDPWWQAPYFAPLYADLYNNHNVSIITRIDYNWGQTVPAPTNPDSATWHNTILNNVIPHLGNYSNIWILGNEPNLIGEGNGWANNQITPTGYAQIYHQVRSAIKAVRPNDQVLLAPVSPGGVVAGVRWMDGNQWLAQTMNAIKAIPGADIDGFAIHAYGNPYASAATAASQFRTSYITQLSVIDFAGFDDKPVYLTEWNRATSLTGDTAAAEAVSAEFLRLAVQGVDTWNRTPGNHNIKAMTWFVGNKDYGGWDTYSLEYWKDHGNPVGTTGDLWTAMMDSMAYPAGVDGTYIPPQQGDADGDFDVDLHDFNILALHFGQATTLGAAAGDFDGNQIVDNDDYLILKAFFGSGTQNLQTPPTLIPEPGFTATALLSLLLCTRSGHTHRR